MNRKTIIIISIAVIIISIFAFFIFKAPYSPELDKAQTDEAVGTMTGTAGDVKEIVDAVHASKDDEKEYALKMLTNISEDDTHMIEEYIRLLDDPDRQVRIAAIQNLGKLKSIEAAPRLREIVKDFNSIEFKTLKLVSREKAYELLFEAGAAAEALGEMKDEEAITLLVERVYEIEYFAAEGLAKMGKAALPELLELAREEVDTEEDYARQALYSVKDPEAKEVLLESFWNTKEVPAIREIVLAVLIGGYKEQSLLEELQINYDKQTDAIRYSLVGYLKKKDDIPFLIWILKNEKKESILTSSIINLGKIGNPSAIPILEELLRGNIRNIRSNIIYAIVAISDKDSLIRLHQYLNNNLGKVINMDYDNAAITKIEEKLR